MADVTFLAVDQGSSGTMTALFDSSLRMIDSLDIPVGTSTPRYGWVEQDPWELLESIKGGIQKLSARNPEAFELLAGIGLANQGESFLLWEAGTGKPLTPVISWQDSRGEDYCSRLRREGYDSWFHEKTGLHLSGEWPALKLSLIRKEDPRLDELCRSGKVAFGQLDAWFTCILSGGRTAASDHGTASRSGLYNLSAGDWDQELLEFFGGADLILPTLVDNACSLPGMDVGIGRKIPWIAGGLDQAMTLIGQGCVHPRTAKVTYGTCCACWMNLGDELILDERLTTSIAWRLGDERTYALAAEGGAAGNIITWLLEYFSDGWRPEELSDLARKSEDQNELVFVPSFQGLFAPYWKKARGTLFGITTGTRPEHILRAGLDAVAYTVKDILDCMPDIISFVADGGMTANDYLMQRQADVLACPVIIGGERDGTLYGIARLCVLSLGLQSELKELGGNSSSEVILPTDDDGGRGYAVWQRAVRAVIDYYDE